MEDNQLHREFTQDVLEGCGYTIVPVRNGGEALDFCCRHQGRIDLVVSDLVMPEMGGPEFVSKLPERLKDVPVVFMSGYAEGAVVERGLLGEGVPFLPKPMSPGVLERKVREVLDAVRA